MTCVVEQSRKEVDGLDPGWIGALGLLRVHIRWDVRSRIRFAQPPADTLWSAIGARLYVQDKSVFDSMVKTCARSGGAPSPFVVRLTRPAGTTLEAGSALEAELVLIGRAKAHLGNVLAAAQEVDAVGSGRNGGGGRIELAEIAYLDSGGNIRETAEPIRRSSVRDLAESLSHNVEVDFRSPVYLKAEGRLAEPSPGLLMRRLGWRMRELVRLHGRGEPPDFRSLLQQTPSGWFSSIAFVDTARFSRRRAREKDASGRIPIRGHVGRLVLRDVRVEARELLVMGQWTAVGKNAERGYGSYELTTA